MPVIEHLNPMIVIAAITGLLSFYYFFALVLRLKKLRLIKAVSRLFSFLFFGLITAAIAIIILGTEGYKGLTKEEKVARVEISPTGLQTYQARLVFNNGDEQVFSLNGDEVLIDAYVLKWKPWVNILGLHSAYRLDRVSGRYRSISDEKQKPRSVFAISNMGDKGIAEWREDYSVLTVLLDVEHGSASFASAEQRKEYHLMVTTDGLLLRPVQENL